MTMSDLTITEIEISEKAISYFGRAIDLDPKNASYFSNKALWLKARSKYQEAIDCYSKVIELKSNNLEAFKSKGICLLNLGKYHEAHECYNKAIELNSNEDLSSHAY